MIKLQTIKPTSGKRPRITSKVKIPDYPGKIGVLDHEKTPKMPPLKPWLYNSEWKDFICKPFLK